MQNSWAVRLFSLGTSALVVSATLLMYALFFFELRDTVSSVIYVVIGALTVLVPLGLNNIYPVDTDSSRKALLSALQEAHLGEGGPGGSGGDHSGRRQFSGAGAHMEEGGGGAQSGPSGAGEGWGWGTGDGKAGSPGGRQGLGVSQGPYPGASTVGGGGGGPGFRAASWTNPSGEQGQGGWRTQEGGQRGGVRRTNIHTGSARAPPAQRVRGELHPLYGGSGGESHGSGRAPYVGVLGREEEVREAYGRDETSGPSAV